MALNIKGKYSILQIPFGTSANAVGIIIMLYCSTIIRYNVVHNEKIRYGMQDIGVWTLVTTDLSSTAKHSAIGV